MCEALMPVLDLYVIRLTAADNSENISRVSNYG